METTPTETQALIDFGRHAWAYFVTHSEIVLVDGKMMLCSVMPASEQVVCVIKDLIAVDKGI